MTSTISSASSRAPRGRSAERSAADAIVEQELQRFATWMGQLDVSPTIAALREHGQAIVERVLAENAGRWEGLSPRDEARVEAVARSVMQRLLHEPTIRLKAPSEDGAPRPPAGRARALRPRGRPRQAPRAPRRGEVRPLRAPGCEDRDARQRAGARAGPQVAGALGGAPSS
jgi:glutamyl-tRNA reductase